jgi:hypothetical protein
MSFGVSLAQQQNPRQKLLGLRVMKVKPTPEPPNGSPRTERTLAMFRHAKGKTLRRELLDGAFRF